MNFYKQIFYILVFFIPLASKAQAEEWDIYMAQYEKGVGSTLINMSAKKFAPEKKFPYVLVTGVIFADCTADGMPSKNEFSHLYAISDSVKAKIDKTNENIAVAAFTYQCERLDYYYLKDTAGLRQSLAGLYSNRFKQYQPYINIKEDKSWDAYLNFLYPNDETLEFMKNQKILKGLEDAGDKLDKARQVDHWIYFKTEDDRTCFINYVTKNNFRIEAKDKTKDISHPYKLQISRTDNVDIAAISGITLDLRKQAQKCKGDYDGWETFVVK